MAEQSGWCFVVGKSAVCRWKVSSFSRGFCVPGARVRGVGEGRDALGKTQTTQTATSRSRLRRAAAAAALWSRERKREKCVGARQTRR